MKKLNNNYWIEKKNVYYNWDKVNWADAKTFEVLSDDFAKDKNKIYLYNYEVVWLDVDSFEVLDEYYLKDKDNIYYIDRDSKIRVVSWADTWSFEVIKWKSQSGLDSRYAKDKKSVFQSWMKLVNSDSETFKFIDEFYSKDKNNVYVIDAEIYCVDEIEDADPETFELLKWGYSKDKNHVYHCDWFWRIRKIDGADSSTFEMTEIGIPKNKNSN